MRPSFVNQPQPFIVSVITDSDPDSAIATMRNSENQGAQAFDLHLRAIEQQYQNQQDLERIIMSTCRPIMVLYYRGDKIWGSRLTDDERVEGQLLALRAGASACDIMGDIYDASPEGITYKPEAVDKQKRLVDRIHSMGGEVVMSCHKWARMTTEQVLEMMTETQSRGADMVKVACCVNSQEEVIEAMATTVALKRELKVPFIHICMGQYGKLHRFVGPMLGSALIFCVERYTPKGHKEQPLIRSAKAVLDNLDWRVGRCALPDEKAGE